MDIDSTETWWAIEPDELQAAPFFLLTQAVKRGDIGTVQRLLQAGTGLLPERPLPASLNPLVIEAACCGQRDVLELVLDQDSSAISAVDVAHGATPLHWAALRGDWGTAHLLLAKRADVMCKSREGLLPLHCAALRGHRALLELLLERGTPVDAPTNSRGATALILAAEGGFSHCVEALLSRRANVDLADIQGITALLAAAASGQGRTARLLLKAGADPAARDTVQGRSVLHWAAYHGLADLAEEMLANFHAEVDQEDAGQETPLLLASRRGSPEVVETLLQRGATVDKAGSEGLTPLMSAAFFDHVPVVEALLGRGASPRAADAVRGRTALHWSAASDAAGAARVLLERGADIAAATDRRGMTPFDLAVELDAERVVELMRAVADRARA